MANVNSIYKATNDKLNRKRVEAIIYAESKNDEADIRKVASTLSNRVKTHKNRESLYDVAVTPQQYTAVASTEYRKYMNDELKGLGEPEKAALVKRVANELYSGKFKDTTNGLLAYTKEAGPDYSVKTFKYKNPEKNLDDPKNKATQQEIKKPQQGVEAKGIIQNIKNSPLVQAASGIKQSIEQKSFKPLVETGKNLYGEVKQSGQRLTEESRLVGEDIRRQKLGLQRTPEGIAASKSQTESVFNLILSTTGGSGAIKKSVSKVASKILPKQEPVKELTDILNKYKPLRGQQEMGFSAERGKRFPEVEKVFQEIGGEAGFKAGLGKLKGELPKVKVPEGLSNEVKDFTMSGKADSLFRVIQQNKWMRTGDKITTQTGLSKALSGQIPTEGELEHLATIFGQKFTDALKVSQPWKFSLWNVASEIGGTMKVLLSSLGDLSFYGRQGIMYATRFPTKGVKLIKSGVKSLASENYYNTIQDSFRTHEYYPIARRFNLPLTEVGGATTKLSQADEQFLIRYIKKIPGIGNVVNATERAFNTMANKARADWFYKLVDDGLKYGLDPIKNPEYFDRSAKFVGSFTGRGDMGKVLNQASELLNMGIYSPRLIKSRLDIIASPVTYLNAPTPLRKETWKTLASYYGTLATVLAGISMASDDVSIELDPRSTDFLKVRIGNRRWDLTGGLQSYYRVIAQMITREKKDSDTGKIKPVARGVYSPELSFIRGKLSPLLGTIIDAWSGETFTGANATIGTLAKEHLVNMMFQDIIDASKESGAFNALLTTGVPASLGVGTQAYKPKGGMFDKLMGNNKETKSRTPTFDDLMK